MKEQQRNMSYNRTAALGLGVAELLIGIFSAAVGIQAYYSKTAFAYIFYGIWCGFLIAVAGIFSIITGCITSRTMNILNSVTAFIGGLAAVTQLVFGVFSLIDNLGNQCDSIQCKTTDNSANYCSKWSDGDYCLNYSNYLVTIFDGSSLVILGAISIGLMTTIIFLACSCCYSHNKVEPLGNGLPNKYEATLDQSKTRRDTEAQTEETIVFTREELAKYIVAKQKNILNGDVSGVRSENGGDPYNQGETVAFNLPKWLLAARTASRQDGGTWNLDYAD